MVVAGLLAWFSATLGIGEVEKYGMVYILGHWCDLRWEVGAPLILLGMVGCMLAGLWSWKVPRHPPPTEPAK